MNETGHISIHTENILPIIKKWLYAEKEVFLRELVANAADALTKLRKFSLVGEATGDIPEAKITIALDKEAKTLTITDSGLGMTADEIRKYINQVAFSGIKDFVEKYKGQDDDHQIIGHFGLGFYSSFMIAHKVEIDTLSFRPGSEAAHWSCDGSTEFSLTSSDRKEIGTSIILHVSEDSAEMLEEGIVQAILSKYCAFIKFPIEMGGKVVNEPHPIWTKTPSQLSDKDYIDFFHKLFPASPDPLFWIHLNVDHPFKLSGVLYFPKLKHELDASQGEVKLYCNQVYVADNAKELIPEFLTLLKGAVDCPDLPLNVSRSALQKDPQAQLISQHIVKKVADKLTGMAKTEEETYRKFWDDIAPFVKFGMMRDHKFAERMTEYILFKSSEGGFTTLPAYQERMKGKVDDKIIYCSDEAAQASYLGMFKAQALEAVIADTMIDQHFLPFLEMESGRKYKFQRIDSDISAHLVDDSASSTIVDPKDRKNTVEKIQDLFKKHLTRTKVKVRIEALNSTVPAVLLFDENMRRFKEMSRMNPYASAMEPTDDDHTLVVNQNSPAVKGLLGIAAGGSAREAEVQMMVDQIYDLAFLQQGKFTPEAMQRFIDRSATLMGRMGGEGGGASSIILGV